jgi:uncharacterized protein YjbJ (UPF0337 family)
MPSNGPQVNRDRIEGNWKQLKGSTRRRWSRLTGNDAGVVAGTRAQLLGKIQEGCGIRREASDKQLAEWLARRHRVDPIHK